MSYSLISNFTLMRPRKNRGFLCKPVADNLNTNLEKFRYFTRLHCYMNWYQLPSFFSFHFTTGRG